ncbi:hypothetical protein OU994_17540 [Pseudoduganella sp. SL102]|uniref:hypothetical protein n=1 Tax=Pseudoduganella sp. SL102 TaxID=2995154 RepID=UPI00248B83C8|nr:hypothetical protein [Pseudoduganella sp. SL102]WBS00126.1 hypothetical protein OU994_17540 [Pseudoduganella sp. SL102]
MSSETIDDYLLHFREARKLLQATQARFDAIADDLGQPRDQRADATAASLDMTRELGQLDAAHATFIATHGPGVPPPTPETVARSLALVTDLAQVLQQEKQVAVLFSAVTRLVVGWRTLTGREALSVDLATATHELAGTTAGAESIVVIESIQTGTQRLRSNLDWLRLQRGAATEAASPNQP